MTDFSALIANPKLMLIGAAAQFGIFGAYMVALPWASHPTRPVPSPSSAAPTAPPPSSCRRNSLPTSWVPSQCRHTLYGSGARDPAPADAPVHHQEGASDQDETRPRRVAEREDHLPHRGYASHLLRGALGYSLARHALLR